MKSFRDITGQEWSVIINTNTVKRVRDLARFDLLKLAEDRAALESLGGDPITLVNVLFAICEPVCAAKNISDLDFAERLNGDALEAGSDAILEELADFFQSFRRGPFKAALKKLRTIRTKAAEMQIQRIESPQLEAKVLTMLQDALESGSTLGNFSGTSPESSASTPAPSLSGN